MVEMAVEMPISWAWQWARKNALKWTPEMERHAVKW
jgi:hypothetical protein